ncbi:MAG: class I SAM-dependent methyltransferase [Hyphomicrobiaceae bacterium]|nr:class I SAM-dependent methyltransferase [Hyphomicrobiaceae bacterium]
MSNAASPAPAAGHGQGAGQTCRLCGASLHHTLVDLGMSPLCESFLAAGEIDRMEPYYPLRVMVCAECCLVQLKEYVAPEQIFSTYAYFSSYSTSWVAHAKAYCDSMQDRFGLGSRSLVVELASNDGYLLQHFLPKGISVLGIEPAGNVAEVARAKGVPTIVDFFGVRLARALAAEGRQADLIVGNNVLAQVPDLNDFVAGMPIILAPEGIVTLEVPHLARLIDERQFDTIYHEHFSYFSLIAVAQLARRHGLKLIDVEELPTHGGSLRVYLAHAGSMRPTAPTVARLTAAEEARGFRKMETYTGFQDEVRTLKRDLLDLLIDLKRQGKRIVGYGAPGKGNTLLNYCGIGTDFLDFTVDRNPYKHGRFTPGMHIPILAPEALDAARPDFVLILPWNLKTEIMAQLAHIAGWGGKFIVPIPTPAIVSPGQMRA